MVTSSPESDADGARRWGGWLFWVPAGLAVTAGWGGAIWLAMHVMPDATLRTVALFAHLAALVVGFGAVLVTDFQALLWLFRRRRLVQVVHVAAASHQLIWIGLLGLVISGSLLDPRLSTALTRVKMGLVLVVALNGLAALELQRRVDRTGVAAGRLPRRLLVAAVVIGTVSQAGWWGATVIGFRTSTRRPVAVVVPARSPTPAPSASSASVGRSPSAAPSPSAVTPSTAAPGDTAPPTEQMAPPMG